MVGIGWIVLVGGLLAQAAYLGTVLGFVGGALIMIVIALCYAEIMSLFPVAGGEFAYAYRIFGEEMAFLCGWILALAYIVVTAFEAISVGWLATLLLPQLKGDVAYRILGQDIYSGQVFIGFVGMFAMYLINARGVKVAAKVQDILVVSLLIVSLVFIAYALSVGSLENMQPLFVGDDAISNTWSVLFVVGVIPFWFAGFDVIPQAMSEKSESVPASKIGMVLVIGIVSALLFYVLILTATALVAPRGLILSSEIPLKDAFDTIYDSPGLSTLVLVAGLLGLLSTWNAIYFAGARVVYALARARFLPQFFSSVHREYRTPVRSLQFVALSAMVLVLLGKVAISPIVNALSSALSAVFFLTCLGVLLLRLNEPKLHRPYKMPGGVLTAVVGTLGAALICAQSLFASFQSVKVFSLPLEWLILLLWLVVGIGFWLVTGDYRKTIGDAERRDLLLKS